jgi:predicted ATP-dependent endonuclease of OLD family
MRIKSLFIDNFRGYASPTTINFESLTAFVGKNDIGKSSILEALYIFFESGKSISIDKNDLNRKNAINGKTDIVIGVEFDSLNDEVVIDETNATTLSSEFLLTRRNTLFIVKRYPNGSKPKIFVCANHPSCEYCNDLLSKKQRELKNKVEKLGLTCDKTKNAEMRKAIWSYYSDNLDLQEREIEVSAEDLKDLWPKLQSYLPIYSLFQADRSNNDSDKEAQDPLKAAVQLILKDDAIQQQLEQIAETVTQQLQTVTRSTLSKLREMNEEVAESLNPNIPAVKELKWADVFKNVSITSDDDIPINKHGSGVKRLVLLNFFRAEVERRQADNNVNIIYAIEEPETSQHLKHQLMLIEALKSLSNQPNIQVVITTHSAHIVKRLCFDSIRLISALPNGCKTVSKVSPHDLPYPSLNEINFLAFEEVSEEFHNELYAYIEFSGWKDEYLKYLNGKPTMTYIRILPNGTTKTEQKCLTEYIRHQIHHPENTLNERYTQSQLSESIKMMRNFLITKK